MSATAKPEVVVQEGINTLKKLLPYFSSHTSLLVIGLLSMLIGIAMSFSVGFLIRYVVDAFPETQSEAVQFLDNALLVAFAYIIVSGIAGFVAGVCLRKLSQNIARDVRKDIFKNLINRSMAYIGQQSSGDIHTRVVADAGAVGRFLAEQVPTIITAGLTMLVGVVGALFISTKLTLIVLCALPFVFLPVIFVSKRLRILGREVQTAIATLGSFTGEVFRNIKVVRAYNRGREESHIFGKKAQNVVDFRMKTLHVELSVSLLVESLALMAFVVLLWSSGKDIFTGGMTVGQLIAFAYFSLMIVQSGMRFLKVVTSLNVAVGTSKKVLEYIADEKVEWPTSVEASEFVGMVEFKNLFFRYPERPDVEVLKGLNLNIRPGTHLALVGHSGAGKSTLFELLLKLYDEYEGEICVDGKDLRLVDTVAFRSAIGYVPQSESLFSGSVKDNIAYGSDGVSEEHIVAAAQMAQADEFIRNLPAGYETDLGEVGGRLSGGQKQRIALARALLRDPKILLLDEAKSALDSESERQVAQAINQWAESRNATVISIAHRPSTIRQADTVAVVDKGVVVDQGDHDSLLKRCPIYERLVFEQSEKLEASEVPDTMET
ncbi:ABC transporter ATP-binding protein [Microbulbifer discodermiae]|uniref:ABC transporter ATP-binding protein n=1 Tax=Microbulbifer sp. 2201CG32-9 TaxID=3232309 RepID=UPI00345C4927